MCFLLGLQLLESQDRGKGKEQQCGTKGKRLMGTPEDWGANHVEVMVTSIGFSICNYPAAAQVLGDV